MFKKKISQNKLDIIHMSLFILILLAFAGYESARKIEIESPQASITDTLPALVNLFSAVK